MAEATRVIVVVVALVVVHPDERDYLEVGNVILNKSVLRPGRWHDVTMVVNCKEGRAFIYVDGKIVRGDGGEHAVVIGEGAGAKSPLAVKRGGFLLFAASEASWMPGGCYLRRCAFTSDCLSAKQLEQGAYQNRLASAKIREYLKEQLPQQELALTPILRRKAMPFWRSGWFLSEFGQAVFPVDSESSFSSFQVFVFAAEKLFQAPSSEGKLSGILGLMSEEAQKARLVCLTGAGFSTESGIPDYRSPQGSYSKGHKPMTHQEFVSSCLNRRRYWARSLRGWRYFDGAAPNSAHRALGVLEDAGYVQAVITQNVDGLHQRAGSQNVIDLHGRNDQVMCLTCSRTRPRAGYQLELEEVNAAWMDAFLPPQEVMDIRADGDAHLDVRSFDGFVVPPCKACGGVWKPRVVFFGGSLESSVKLKAQEALRGAEALLVMGTSAKVFSAFSLVRLAAEAKKPVALVNIGETRADPLVSPDLRMHMRCSEALSAAEPLFRRLSNALESPEPQVIVFFLKAVKQLRARMSNVGDACIIPLAVGSTVVPLMLEKTEGKDGPNYRLTICNGGPGVLYHRQSARSPPKLKHQTCMTFDGIPAERAEDEAFWTTMVTACLISSEREPEDLLYDVFLPYLIKAPAVVDALYPKGAKMLEGLSIPDSDFHSRPRAFGPWRGLTLLWKHLLRSKAGLTKQQVKAVKWELRATMVDMCVHDLKASKGLDSTDLRLLKLGCGTMSFAAVRNHTCATDCRSDEDSLSLPAANHSLFACKKLVDAIDVLCSQKPRTYEGQDGSGEFSSYLDLDTGEEKVSQSAIFPFFDRLLRQEARDSTCSMKEHRS
ncbi:SRT2 [Symbiodinium sp. CCMP2456]|nr:SRT2 [Symbiodinium sp. CCMP2456]